MLKFNVQKLLKNKGVINPTMYLQKAGLASGTATKYKNSELRNMRLDHLEKLCEIMNCTPNELLEWIPNSEQLKNKNHPLMPLLKRKENMTLASEGISYLALNDLEKVVKFIDELKKPKPNVD